MHPWLKGESMTYKQWRKQKVREFMSAGGEKIIKYVYEFVRVEKSNRQKSWQKDKRYLIQCNKQGESGCDSRRRTLRSKTSPLSPANQQWDSFSVYTKSFFGAPAAQLGKTATEIHHLDRLCCKTIAGTCFSVPHSVLIKSDLLEYVRRWSMCLDSISNIAIFIEG